MYEELLKPHCAGVFHVHYMKWEKSRFKSKVISLINYLYNSYLNGWHILPAYEMISIIRKHKIDLVHTNTILGLDAAIAARLSHRPHVWHIRELIGNNSQAIIALPFQRYGSVLRKVLNSLADIVITNSLFTSSHVTPYFSREKIITIHNSLPSEWFKLENKIIIPSEFRVGIVANITSKSKNHKLAILVAELVKTTNPNIKFYFYGNLPTTTSNYLQSLKDSIIELNLSDTVYFKGSVEKTQIYREIDILFHPATNEGFGRIIIEAMGKGIPVVAVAGGGVDELFEDGVTGFRVDANNPRQIADRIIELAANQSLYERLSVAGFNHASKNFILSDMWAKIESCYNLLTLKYK